jgi:hypothetical protein
MLANTLPNAFPAPHSSPRQGNCSYYGVLSCYQHTDGLLQHRVKLSAFTHGAEALEDEGKNAEVSTSPASQRIAVRTTASRVHMYRVQQTTEQALPPSLVNLAPALRPAHIVLTQSVDVSAFGCSCALLAGALSPSPSLLSCIHFKNRLSPSCL